MQLRGRTCQKINRKAVHVKVKLSSKNVHKNIFFFMVFEIEVEITSVLANAITIRILVNAVRPTIYFKSIV